MTAPTGPRWLLTQNSELREDGVFCWTLPAWAGRFPSDGRTYNTCPEAGECRNLCYARSGTFQFSNVLAAHQRNLRMVMDTPWSWEQRMTRELTHRRYGRRWVRVHDSGDFWSDAYTTRWLRIMSATPNTGFYAYTKAVSRFKRLVEGKAPPNFLWVYSLGGTEDHLLDLERDRHADVFTDTDAMKAAGYADQSASDLLAILGPQKVGIPANNIPHLRKRQGADSFGALQRAADAQARARKEARRGPSHDRPTVP